ncbi:MAG: Ku protein [Thermoanaerobacteraceae bacterium]|uniref:non-homologous end joining protein Ku n=1 Tax=Thermanaeromonas sp. C210 TaxID=2731925 RepID=UPI00155CC5B9|nr:Ku protein [Thermanaeromonas sp. C210]MBE3582379.1 Ku protein [Thermoanaerobacteraceae bacterium]GFN23805.1 non-homologous end joining protein Ku [Thermanaeromonas sp. C210]
MRPLWKGAISFGLVYIPVKLYRATESNGVKFNYLHAKCKTPIRYRRYCPYCQVEVPLEEIVRGYEYEKGKYVVLREEDLEDLPREATRTINLLDFVDLREIDPVYFDRSYYLTPADGGQKAYALLWEALKATGKIGIAKVALRNKTSLAAVRVYDKSLMLNTMIYPEELRSVGELAELKYEVRLETKEVEMAVTLINTLTAEFRPEKYTDEYRQALRKLVEAKIAGQEVEVPARPEAHKVVDLMEALKASIEMVQKEEKAGARRRRKTS